ncbi:TatD family hydrolase [Arthrobacter sp. YD2]|uniref:TatD family hydrolase n=1 Tax=Arthrobacter sp. YD2 TaxID=3058046 RepID=UPI0025B28956|nr:TatD family hydrolase [Arthrobacter sp. YD2]MDN3905285.1 TatD family hydrolase [Arthrobacter sp. YD2]
MSKCSGYVPGSTPAAYLPEGTGADAVRHKGKGYPPAPEPLPVPVMDNHTHFDFPAGDFRVALGAALDAAEAAGVKGAIQVGTDLESSRFTAKAVDADRRLLGAVAIHPNDAPQLAAEGTLDAALAEIEALAAHPRIRAIGETGLDYFRTGEDGLERQQYSFRRHMDIAKRLGLALQIHDRDAHADVVRLLKEEGAPDTVVFHCFSGDAELARICNENGWYMSFSGTVTFKNSHGLHQALAEADRNLLLVETDAPFLTPHPHRGRPNASYMVPYTVRFMADRLDLTAAELGESLAANTERAYGSWTDTRSAAATAEAAPGGTRGAHPER